MARPVAPAATVVQSAAPAPAPVAAPKPAPATPTPAAPSAPVPEGGTRMTSPMPGTILDIKVNVGDPVKNGQVLLILEAMKMENEIMSPVDGRIAAIPTTKGASVNSGELLIVIE